MRLSLFMLFAIFFATVNAQTVIFEETFAGCNGKGGNDGSWSGNSIANGTFTDGTSSDNSGWTLTKGNVASGCIKLGSTKAQGSAVTPAFSKLSGDATLTFDAGAWEASSESTTLNVSISDGYFDKAKSSTSTTVTLVKGSFTSYTLSIYGGSSTAKVTFKGNQAKNSRFFLDNVKVTTSGDTPATDKFEFSSSTATATMGETFTAPTLTNTYGTTATYTSSKTSVATVDASTGEVTLVAAGETTITATDGTNSASYTLTVKAAVEALESLKALRTQIESDNSTSNKEYKVKLTNAVVTFVSGSTAVIEEDGIGIIYYKSGNTFAAGDVLSGTATVSGLMYNGNYAEITSLTGITAASGTAPDPTVVTIKQLQDDFASYGLRYVKVKNATVATAFSSGNATITDASSTTALTIYDSTKKLSVTVGNNVNVTGISNCYKSTAQIQVYSADDIETVTSVETPEFSVTQGIYSETQSVAITCATSDATIYYTTDGTDPTSESTQYTEALSVKSSEKIKAIAISGSNESAIATAIYVIGDGATYDDAFTPKEVILMKELGSYPSNDVWVMGYIVGSAKSATGLEETDVDTNVALAETENETSEFITVALPINNNTKYLQTLVGLATNPSNKGKLICAYGAAQSYWNGGCGIKKTSKVYNLTTVKIAFSEGYGTYYSNYPFEMPEGVTGCIITDANVGSGTLTIEEKYAEGETVPACTPLLLKGEQKEYSVVNTNSSAEAPEDNLLKGSAEAATTEGGTYYYMLSHDKNGGNVGFYWGAENGGAFTNKAGKAYLALNAATAAKAFVLDGSTTGISAIAGESSNDAVYTLSGMKLNGEKLQKGIYIKNGRKFIVK